MNDRVIEAGCYFEEKQRLNPFLQLNEPEQPLTHQLLQVCECVCVREIPFFSPSH